MADSILSTLWDYSPIGARYNYVTGPPSPASMMSQAQAAVSAAMSQTAGKIKDAAPPFLSVTAKTDAEAYARVAGLLAAGARELAGTPQSRTMASAAMATLTHANTEYGTIGWELHVSKISGIYAYGASVLRSAAASNPNVLWLAGAMLSKMQPASMTPTVPNGPAPAPATVPNGGPLPSATVPVNVPSLPAPPVAMTPSPGARRAWVPFAFAAGGILVMLALIKLTGKRKRK